MEAPLRSDRMVQKFIYRGSMACINLKFHVSRASCNKLIMTTPSGDKADVWCRVQELPSSRTDYPPWRAVKEEMDQSAQDEEDDWGQTKALGATMIGDRQKRFGAFDEFTHSKLFHALIIRGLHPNLVAWIMRSVVSASLE